MSDRKDFIGGSDAARILSGDWLPLWKEKTGRQAEANLDHVFEVQLGRRTETFHLDWLNRYHGFDIANWGVTRVMHGYPYIRATLDGWCHNRKTFVEVKHSNGRADRERIISTYQPQMAHYCNVTGEPSGWLSYIAGNAPPDYFLVEPSKAYRDQLLELEAAFWWHVTQDVEPAGVEVPASLEAAAGQVKIDALRVVDMNGNNEWASLAADYIINKDTAASFEKAKAGLKKLVEADVRIASGHGISIKRNKAGSLLISEGL